jgi:hypothetical protein
LPASTAATIKRAAVARQHPRPDGTDDRCTESRCGYESDMLRFVRHWLPTLAGCVLGVSAKEDGASIVMVAVWILIGIVGGMILAGILRFGSQRLGPSRSQESPLPGPGAGD